MRLSQLFTKTTKTAPGNESARNAVLLIQAGYIYKVMAGVYAYTPLGLRVVERIKQIVREEMNAIGGQELIMSSLQHRSTWDKTTRWDDEVVDVWFKSKLQDGTEVGFAWSHEEAIMEMMSHYIESYKDLPVYAYQFQTKMRNELRSKSGTMRGREFVMKDMYSLCVDAEQHDKIYQATTDAYMRCFERFGIGADTYVTFASGGAFTKYSHEFQTLTDAGEDVIYMVPSTKQAFNEEIAPAQAPKVARDAQLLPMEEVEGKGIVGVEELAKTLKLDVEKTTKTMLYVTDTGTIVAAAVRGRYRIDESKLKDVVGAQKITLADEATVKKVTGAEVGYAGLLNLPTDVRIVVDESCGDRTNFEMGANRTNYHSINVNWGRDLPEPDEYYDIKVAQAGDIFPETGEEYKVHKTAEVGNIFNFGTDKAEQMQVYFTNEQGVRQPIFLGSYGIGITRVMGVIAEKFSDDKGLVWPLSIAPAAVYIARIGSDDATVAAADDLYTRLTTANIQVLYDDRDLRPGEKFADADLMGIPYRVVVSPKTIAAGTYECKARTTTEVEHLSYEQLVAQLNVK